MRILRNFLNSGYTFSEEEYELQSKYILFNSMLAISIIIISLVIFIQISKSNFDLVWLNIGQIFIASIGIFILRFTKKIYIIVYITFGLAILLLSFTVLSHPADYMRIAWFLILIIVAFLFNGRKLGYPVAVLSLLIIVMAYFLNRNSVDLKPYLLMFWFSILITILVQLYETREYRVKNKLHSLNTDLENRVAEETKKRIEIYIESNKKLEIMAHYDSLTKLPNRILFFDRLEQAILKAERNKTKLALLFLDIDNFKEINDSFGHIFGDRILEIFAKRLRRNMRQSDSLARFGGDEFIIMIEEIHTGLSVVQIAQGINKAFLKPVKIEKRDFYLTASIGVAIYPKDGTDSEALLKHADVAMHSAKKNDKNQVMFYDKEMTDYAVEKLILDQEIRQGIKNDEFVVYYQPVINNRDKSLAGFEALVRWNHPTRGLMMPDAFIPIAEMSSMIVDLGEKILQIVADQIVEWHRVGFDPAFVAVNISPKQLRDPNLTSILNHALDRVVFRRDWLEIEITEGYAIQNLDSAIEKLHEINNLGIPISLDDFGTGYSSLSYLKKLPVQKLKIDRLFIRDIVDDEEDRILVKAIISFSHELSLKVVAEGVENAEQWNMIKSMECELTQGYHFGKPMSISDIEKKFIGS